MDPTFVHQTFLGSPVTEDHAKLYGNFPKYRGFSSDAPTPEDFAAAFVVALMQVLWAQDGLLKESFILVPAHKIAWANDQLSTVTRQMFARWKGRGTVEERKRIVGKLSRAFGHLMVGSRVLQMGEPARWVAVGFRVEDPVPDWMKAALLLV